MATETEPERPLVADSVDMPAAFAGMDDVHAALARFWAAAEPVLPTWPDGRWRGLFDSTVAEIAANIVRHAYPPEQTGGRFSLDLRGFPDRVEASLYDNGVRYEPPPALPDVDLSDALASSGLDGGWGLPIAWAAVDRLEYERTPEGRNCWRIEKRLVTAGGA